MTDTNTLTITVCEDTLAQVANYNKYREASRVAHDAEYEAIRSGDEEAIRKAKREVAKAAKSYANFSMSLGWFFASKLRDAGVEVK